MLKKNTEVKANGILKHRYWNKGNWVVSQVHLPTRTGNFDQRESGTPSGGGIVSLLAALGLNLDPAIHKLWDQRQFT